MQITYTRKDTKNHRLTPMALGNGNLSMLLGPEASMDNLPWSMQSLPAEKAQVWQAGIRYDDPNHSLAGLGRFSHLLANTDWNNLKDFRWEFDTDGAIFRGTLNYSNGTHIEMELFCALDTNVMAIHRKIRNNGAPSIFRYDQNTPRMTQTIRPADIEPCGAEISWTLDTMPRQQGKIWIFSDMPAELNLQQSTVEFTFDAREYVLFLCFDEAACLKARQQGWDGLLDDNRWQWRKFWQESTLNLPEESRLAKVCRAAEYHLRISTTQWSIPTGIYPTHWDGHYFGFDEFFAFDGLLATGHLDTARHVPDFRFAILPDSKARCSLYMDKNGDCAEYAWQNSENGFCEASGSGFWLHHIFHMAHIALSSYRYVLCSQNTAYLREKAWHVIRACAEYYRQFHIYHTDSGKYIIGKCTDLERLGPARENAFMTTCGVIATFKAAADCAKHLNTDEKLAVEWRRLAKELTDSLPTDGSRYLVYPDGQEASIALLAGIYPYEQVLSTDGPLFRNALEYFLTHVDSNGNMYPMGKSICMWYGGWSAIVLHRLGRDDEAHKILAKLANDTGCGCECYEIYERGDHPYFTTGEGIFLKAVALTYGVDYFENHAWKTLQS